MKVCKKAENTQGMESCPKFETCDAPRCPLDELCDVRVKLPGEPVCTLRKDVRLRLGADLPNHGLFPAEVAAIKRFYGSIDAYLEHRLAKAERDEGKAAGGEAFA